MIQVHPVSDGAPHTSEKDAALAVVSDVAQEIVPAVERRVVRKIDLYLMPAMLIGEATSMLTEKPWTDQMHRIWNGVL